MIERVAVFSSTRADYNYQLPIAHALRNCGIAVSFFVGGSHLRPGYGDARTQMRKEGFAVTTFPLPALRSDEGINQALIDASILQALPSQLKKKRCEMVVILGDRSEALAAALAAAHAGLAIAHIHGGDRSCGGGIDDGIRHAITKLAHLHFPASVDSARRIKSLGEEPWRIETAGETSVENISAPAPSFLQRYSLPARYAVVLQHGEALNAAKAHLQLRTVLRALTRQKITPVVILPNDDPGAAAIRGEIENQSKKSPIKSYVSLRATDYFDLLRNSLFLIGNSSSALIEAPYLGVAAINLGLRQRGRKSYAAVLHGEFKEREISALIATACSATHKRKVAALARRLAAKPPASRVIAARIKKTKLTDRLFQKVGL